MNQKTLAFTFDKAIEGFLLNLHANGFSKSTIDIYKWDLLKFRPYVPEDVGSISKEDLLNSFSAIRESGLKPASIQNVWIAMRKFFSWVSEEFNFTRIDKGIPCPKVTPPIIKPFTQNEISFRGSGQFFDNRIKALILNY